MSVLGYQGASGQEADAAAGLVFVLTFALVVVSAIGVYIDARSIGARRGLTHGLAGTGPGMWAFGTVAMWIVVFPLYLANRSKIRAIANQRGNRSGYSHGRPSMAAAGSGSPSWQPHGVAPAPQPQPPVQPPAGWYDDPGGSGYNRWWDGYLWTEHRTSKPV